MTRRPTVRAATPDVLPIFDLVVFETILQLKSITLAADR